MDDSKHLKVTCPWDGVEADVTSKEDGMSFSCSNMSACGHCPTKCGARAVLVDPKKARHLQIVCPSDGTMARVEVKGGKLTWCSHSSDMPDCKMDCIRSCGC